MLILDNGHKEVTNLRITTKIMLLLLWTNQIILFWKTLFENPKPDPGTRVFSYENPKPGFSKPGPGPQSLYMI